MALDHEKYDRFRRGQRHCDNLDLPLFRPRRSSYCSASSSSILLPLMLMEMDYLWKLKLNSWNKNSGCGWFLAVLAVELMYCRERQREKLLRISNKLHQYYQIQLYLVVVHQFLYSFSSLLASSSNSLSFGSFNSFCGFKLHTHTRKRCMKQLFTMLSIPSKEEEHQSQGLYFVPRMSACASFFITIFKLNYEMNQKSKSK